MKSHRIEEHVADVRARAYGDTLPELFQASLEAMNEISRANGDRASPAPSMSEAISLTAPDTTALLIDFLSETLTRGHLQGALFHRAEFDELTERSLRGTLHGTKVDRLDKDIKAVTYHEADVHKNAGGQFETTIVFDI
jgi:SHS2 domain-containing protein